MNDLRSFSALQSRLYEFLAHQDEATLQGIVNGTVRLAVVADSAGPAPVSAAPRTAEPSSDPFTAAQELPKLATPHDRQVYLNACGLTMARLRQVAKLLGLRRYSGLSKAELTAFIAGHRQDRADPVTVEPEVPGPSPVPPPVPSPVSRSTEPTEHDADAAAIAAHLRDTETEDEGAAYLRAQGLDRAGLLAVATELQLTRVDRLKPSELEKRVLKQAIGARRKFAGLRKW